MEITNVIFVFFQICFLHIESYIYFLIFYINVDQHLTVFRVQVFCLLR